MTTYDAVVVGAGPAGASAAHVLAQGGARVLLLERARIPRYKPCGGGITARARAASPLVAGFSVETSARGMYLANGEQDLYFSLPAAVDMVMRDRFDAYLVQRAVECGAELRDGCTLSALEREAEGVRLRAGAETIETRYVIGADGANGVTARFAGFPAMRDPGAAIEVELAVASSTRQRFQDAALLDLLAVPGGYGWIFGKGEQLSVGLGVFQSGARRDLRADLARFMDKHAALRGGRVLLRRGHRIPLAGGRSTRRRGPVLLAGDAASLADPLTAEGISYALASGRRAGATVLAALQSSPEILNSYDRYLQDELGGDLRYARAIAAFVYRYPDLVVRLSAVEGRLREANTAAVSGTGQYRTLALRMARRAPALARAVLIRRWAA